MEDHGVWPEILDPITKIRQDGGGSKLRIGRQRAEGQRAKGCPDRRSVQYLVDFLREDSHAITELELCWFFLAHRDDGSLGVLQDFFANDSTLSHVTLFAGYFGTPEAVTELFAALNTNGFVTDVVISTILDVPGVALGQCLSALLLNNEHLQRLDCSFCSFNQLGVDGIRAFLPSLRTNRHLKKLYLHNCTLGDEGFRLLVDALIGNTTLEELDISWNGMTGNSIVHIVRLLDSSQLKEIINLGQSYYRVIVDSNTVQSLANALSRNMFLQSLDISSTPLRDPDIAMIFHALESNTSIKDLRLSRYQGHEIDQLMESLPRMKGIRRLCMERNWRDCLDHVAFLPALRQNTSLEELPGLTLDRFPTTYHDQVVEINNILSHRRSMRRAKALLELQPRTARTGPRPIGSKSGLWPKAMAQFDACAIFHILQKRPALLERQLRRPQQQAHGDDGTSNQGINSSSASSSGSRKRARLSD